MKKLWIICLALVMLLVLVACDKQDTPLDTTGEAEVTQAETQAQTTISNETLAETTHQEETTVAETLDAAYILDKILDSQNIELSTEEDWALDLDVLLDMTTNANGMNTNISMEMGMNYVTDQANGISIVWNIPTMGDMALVYVEDTLYVNMDESKFCSTISAEEFQTLLGELTVNFGIGGDGEADTESETTVPENNPLDAIQSMIAMMRPSALFAEVSCEMGEGDTYVITAKGMSEQANTLMDSIFATAITPDITQEDTAAMNAILEMFDMDNMTFTFVADQAYVLQSVTVATTVDMSLFYGYEAGTQMMADMTMTLAIDQGDQTVTAPTDKDTYISKHWREIFGMETAEMLGLVANENHIIVLETTDIEKLDKQLNYIGEHLEEFATTTFTIHALFNDLTSYDMSKFSDLDMTAYIMGVIVPVVEGEDEFPTYIDIYVPDEMVEGINVEAGSSVTATFTLIQGDVKDAFFDNYIYFQLVSCTTQA